MPDASRPRPALTRRAFMAALAASAAGWAGGALDAAARTRKLAVAGRRKRTAGGALEKDLASARGQVKAIREFHVSPGVEPAFVFRAAPASGRKS